VSEFTRLYKAQRKTLYEQCVMQAGVIMALSDLERPVNTTGGRDTLSHTEAQLRKKGVLDSLYAMHPSLPYVVIDYIKPHVAAQIIDNNEYIDLGDLPVSRKLAVVAGQVAIMATGIDRVVRGDFNLKEVWATPDDHPLSVQLRYNISDLPFQQTVEYARWRERQKQ
jgi:hypothetical protein